MTTPSRTLPLAAILFFAPSARAADPPAKPLAVKGMPESRFAQLPDDQVVEVDGRKATIREIKALNASKLRAGKARLEPKQAQFRARAATELERLKREAAARHAQKVAAGKQLVAAELAKLPPAGDDSPPAGALEARAAALRRREANARTAADWIALEEEARALLAQAGR